MTVCLIDPLSNETTFGYDAVGRKIAQEDALGNETQWIFADDYRVPSQIDEIEQVPGGGTQTFVTEIVTDELHRVKERRVVDRLNSANKHVFKTKYTSLSVPVEEEDALGNKTYAVHDGLGRVTHTARDLGNSEAIDTSFGFDENGNQVTLTDDIIAHDHVGLQRPGSRVLDHVPGQREPEFLVERRRLARGLGGRERHGGHEHL